MTVLMAVLKQHVLSYRLCGVVACLMMVGCTSLSTVTENVSALKLLPPATVGLTGVLKQSVQVTYKGHSQTFILITRHQQETLKSVALLSTGQTLFQATYDGETLHSKRFVPTEIPIATMLAEMQFSLWPAEHINSHYSLQEGWGVTIQKGMEQELRLLSYQGKKVLNVMKNKQIIRITNYESGYQVDVRLLK